MKFSEENSFSFVLAISATTHWLGSLSGENCQLGTDDEPVEFEKESVEVRVFRRITNHFRRIYRRIYLKS